MNSAKRLTLLALLALAIAAAPILAQGFFGTVGNAFGEVGDFFGDLFGGQNDAVRTVVLHVDLSSLEENPAITDRNINGTATVRIRTERQDSGGDLMRAIVTFDANLNGSQAETITAYHIHRGRAGVNGPVVINPQLDSSVALSANSPTRISKTITINDPAQLDVIKEILSNPSNFYLNYHSQSAPGGITRGQLRESDLASSRRIERQMAAQFVQNQQDLVDIKRLVVLMAFRDGIINPQERDQFLTDLRNRQTRINQLRPPATTTTTTTQ